MPESRSPVAGPIFKRSPIAVIDDDPDYLALLGTKLARAGYSRVTLETDPLRMATHFESGARYDLALIDMSMPTMTGLELLERIRSASPDTECIIITAVNEATTAVACLKQGAYDYLVKPVPAELLALSVNRALERKRLLDILRLDKKPVPPPLAHPEAFAPILTESPRLLRVLKEAELHAASDDSVLITGESGTGKELLARAIHLASPRAPYRFTPINMASLTPTLFEAEFFGHTKGAFTGADARRTGYLEHTHHGTLFLDEIGDLSLELQGKLLRVLQEGEYARLGSSRQEVADLRFIAATNEDLEQKMVQQRFRKDLYYRIRGSWLHLPPLRERREDIPLLAAAFLAERPLPAGARLSDNALERLLEHDYPGNVRELQSVVRSAANLAGEQIIRVRHLPEYLRRSRRARPRVDTKRRQAATIRPLADVEREHILRAYEQLDGNKSRTARALGIGLNTLRRKLERFGVP